MELTTQMPGKYDFRRPYSQIFLENDLRLSFLWHLRRLYKGALPAEGFTPTNGVVHATVAFTQPIMFTFHESLRFQVCKL